MLLMDLMTINNSSRLTVALAFLSVNQSASRAVKISILIFYKRPFPSRGFGICAWVGIVVISLWGAIFFFERLSFATITRSNT
jgi:hypothetical protein